MNLRTKYHGEIEIEEKDIVKFEQGIPGFGDKHSFTILPLDTQESTFFILQSTETEELAFVIANPFLFFKDYEFTISNGDKEFLKLINEHDTGIWSIVTLRDPFVETTVNLQAPIIINQKNNQAKQIILNDATYTTRHKLVTETITK